MNSLVFLMMVMGVTHVASAQHAPPGSAGDSGDAVARLHAVFDARHRWRLHEFPEEAMSKGDYSQAHRITDSSVAAIERRHRETVRNLEQLGAIDRMQLTEPERVNHELFELELRNAIEGHQHRTFLAPMHGRSGPQQDIPEMAERVRFNNVDDYENYLKRLAQVPKLVDDTIERLKTGLAEGRTPPQVCAKGVPGQFEALLSGEDGLAALARPFAEAPAGMTEAQLADVERRFRTQALPAVRAALEKLAAYFVNDYLPRCRTSIAATEWPNGEAYYNFQLRVMSTTTMTAREIHELGMKEVARIRAEMLEVIRRSDFLAVMPQARSLDEQALFTAFITYLRTDSRFYHASEDDLLSGYRDICKRVDALLPAYFRALPRLPYGVEPIPAFMAPQQTTAYYQHGDIRNFQAGYFMANTYDLRQRPKYEMIPLAMHEAVPGHHLQVALAQELHGLPEFRKDAWFTAFGEGWALYSERLGIEMDLYEDPYDDFGRLLYEMWRACRLVVDPGMHALGWPREQAVQFMLKNTALSELNISNEIDRYIAWPGQAVGYKIGELKIRELRAKAERELAAPGKGGFDIRAFHDVVLSAGCVPLTVLERRVNEWIDQAAASAADENL